MKMDNERHKEEFEEVQKDCPWAKYKGDGIICLAITGRMVCEQKNCALFYFKNFFERRTK